MTELVAVAGVAPGVGKSTVSGRLVDWLTGSGLNVEHFREEDVLSQPDFARVADEFAKTGTVDLRTLLAATADYVTRIQAAGVQVAVTDSLAPFIPSLMAWGHDDEVIGKFLDELTAILAPVRPVMVYLDGDPHDALARAAEREGAGWLDEFVSKLARYRVSPVVTDIETACAYQELERDTTLRLLAAKNWHVVLVERADERSENEVARRARNALRAHLLVATR